MSAVEVLALALLASAGLSACTLLIASAAERISADPQWRDRLWSAAFWLPVAAPLLTALFLLMPSPKGEPVSVASGAVFQGAETITMAATPAAAPATSAPWMEWTTVAVVALVVAGLLSILRLGQLVLRARRLARVVGRAERAGPEWKALIGGRPCTDLRVSAFAEEAFLAGLRRPVLVLPESLTQAGSGAVRAVIDHELAHLRRNDLIALWLEEAARVVLAGNPLMPLLHARRSLAREEACDALALHGADASTRRLYARALIDAFRHRAATPASGLALTFTRNKGDSAMRRIKAVLDPRPSAGRLTRRLSLAAAVIVGGAVCAGSLALAGQRERPTPVVGAAATNDAESDAAEAAVQAAQASAQAAWERLSPEQQARLREPTGTDFRAICRSDDPADVGYCMGVILAAMSDEAVGRAACASPDNHPAVMRARAAVAQVPSWPGQRPVDVAKMAVMSSSPCDGASSDTPLSPIPLIVSVQMDGQSAVLRAGEALRVTLMDEAGTALWTYMTNIEGRQAKTIQISVERDLFPRFGQANRVLHLTARIQGEDGQIVRSTEPMTIRLAPMSEGSVRRLRPVLSLRSQV